MTLTDRSSLPPPYRSNNCRIISVLKQRVVITLSDVKIIEKDVKKVRTANATLSVTYERNECVKYVLVLKGPSIKWVDVKQGPCKNTGGNLKKKNNNKNRRTATTTTKKDL